MALELRVDTLRQLTNSLFKIDTIKANLDSVSLLNLGMSVMFNATEQTYEDYMEWRDAWKNVHAKLVLRIKELKKIIRKDGYVNAEYQHELSKLQKMATSMYRLRTRMKMSSFMMASEDYFEDYFDEREVA